MPLFNRLLTTLLLLSFFITPKLVHADEEGFSSSGDNKGIVIARLLKKKDNRSPTDLELHLRVQNLVNTFNMTPAEVVTVNRSIKSVALYRYIDVARYRLEPKLYNLVEDTLLGKILVAKSFAVKECMECDPEKLVVRESSLPSLGGTDLAKSLAKIAGRVRVDGFLVWNIYRAEKQLYLSVAIINARTGGVVWSRRFNEMMVPFKVIIEPESQYEKVITFSMWGHEVSRTYKTTELVLADDIIGAVSFKIRRDAKENRNFIYGVGGDYFKNVYTKDDTDITGFTFYGHLNYKLDRRLFGEPAEPVIMDPITPAVTPTDPGKTDTTAGSTVESIPIIKRNTKYVSKYNLYLNLGQAFFMNEQTFFAKTGFELRAEGGLIVDFGAVYLPKIESIMTIPSGYNPTVSFGGTSIEISLGYLF